jgi:acetylornithine deacetylase/succinyl-diaminopimelate desuccinylase-like protein
VLSVRARPSRLPVVLLPLLLVFLSCPRSEATVDRGEPEAEAWLSRYLQIDTTNPPGNETAGAEFLRQILAQEGIEARLLGQMPRRQSLYARLASGSDRPALLLIHHIDVVPARAAEWQVPPFSGELRGGYIWGRGALDAKSLGIAHLSALVELKRRGTPLSRDIIFLAAADEERGGIHGVAALLDQHPELFSNVGTVLNEGGRNQTIVDRISYWGIEVDQKLPLWIRLSTTGEGGHGAAPPSEGGAADRLINVLAELGRIESEYRLLPSVARELRLSARVRPPAARAVMEDPTRFFGTSELAAGVGEGRLALLRDTRSIGRLEAGTNVNSIPSQAVAEIDYRLLPDREPRELLQRIEQIVGDRARVEVLLISERADASPIDTPLYRYLENRLPRVEPGSFVVPIVNPGTTDSRYFRLRGIPSYGFTPFKVNYYDAATIHAANEKIRARFFAEGVRLMREIVHDLATSSE